MATSWKAVAALLADRLAEWLGCPVHDDWRDHWQECAHCADLQAYSAYLEAGGRDARQPRYGGKSVTVAELRAREATDVRPEVPGS